MPSIQGPPPGTLGPPPFRGLPPANGTILRGPAPSSMSIPLAPPGGLPHPSLTRSGFTMPPPGAPSLIPPPPQFLEPPAPGGPPNSTLQKNRSNLSDGNTSSIGATPKLGTHVPLAKCRVLYIGSAVPTETSVGLEAVQQPLNDRYRTNGVSATNVPGVDAWLTVFSSGILMQFTGDKSVITWMPIHTLHVSAAVKCVPQMSPQCAEYICKFMSLDSPPAKSSDHPPIFAAIMRRTTGVKVLECHAFICKSEAATLALVQSTTHAYEHKEGWAEETPPRELYQTLEANINTADPDAEPNLPIFQPSDKECQDRPPVKGYFCNARNDLVRSFNVHHPNQRKGISPQLMSSVVPPPNPRSLVRPLPMVPAGPSNSNPYLLPTPKPPAGYFDDWEAFTGLPMMVFPGPYMSQDEYKRTIREVRSKRKPRAYDRRRNADRDRGDRDRNRTYDRHPPPRHSERPPPEFVDPRDPYYGRRRGGPPSDYVDDMGNRYYQGRPGDEYGYSYRGELPRAIERMPHMDDPNMYVYAPRYASHIDPDIDYDDRQYQSRRRDDPGPSRYEERPDYDRFPRNDRDFGQSVMEERRLVGEPRRPDPYDINDYRGRDDIEIFRDGGYGDLTRDLGYFP